MTPLGYSRKPHIAVRCFSLSQPQVTSRFRRSWLRNLLKCCCLLVCGYFFASGWPLSTPHAASDALGQLLQPDGTLAWPAGYHGSFDARGYRLKLGPGGVPQFVQQTTPADARWDGQFSSFGFDGSVYALAVNGNDLYVGGNFNHIGALSANFIAKWNGETQVWSALGNGSGLTGNGVSDAVFALTISQNRLYVGGRFQAAYNNANDSLSATSIAAWDLQAQTWSLLGTPLSNGVNGTVLALAANGNQLFVGGAFHTVNQADGTRLSANHLAGWDGVGWTALGAGSGRQGNGTNGTVRALVVSGATLYAGGSFSLVFDNTGSPLAANHLATWDGNQWGVLGAEPSPGGNGVDNTVYALATRGAEVYVGGAFKEAYDSSLSRLSGVGFIARWDGAKWRTLGTGDTAGVNFHVRALLTTENAVYAGGLFNQAGNLSANRVARFELASQTWARLGADTGTEAGNGADNYVHALAWLNGELCAGGDFSVVYQSVGQSLRANRIARFNGQTWARLGQQTQQYGNGLNGPVYALVVQGEKVFVGGAFTAAGGISANGIACWNSLTNTWSVLGEATANGVNGTVRALALVGSALYVGGSFNRVFNGTGAGSYVQNIARWNLETQTWTPLGVAAATATERSNGVDSTVYALAAAGQSVYVGGSFGKAYSGTGSAEVLLANCVAVWRNDAQRWAPLGSAEINGTSATVYALAVQAGQLYLGGAFRQVKVDRSGGTQGLSANYIAKFDGTDWARLGADDSITGNGVNAPVYTLATRSSELLIGGAFTQAYQNANSGGVAVNGFARWDGLSWQNTEAAGVNGTVHSLAVSGADVYLGGSFTLAGYHRVSDSGVTAARLARWNGADWTSLGSGTDAPVQALALSPNSVWVGGQFWNAGLKPAQYFTRYADAPLTNLTVAAASVETSATPQTVSLSASVSNGAPLNSGAVSFTVKRGAIVIGAPVSVPVSNGMATASYALPGGLAVGAYLIEAVYSGDTAAGVATGSNSLTVAPPNAPPVITLRAPLTRPQGSAGMKVTLAEVSDSQTPAGNLSVSLVTTLPGLTVSELANHNGQISVTLGVNCQATVGTQTLVLSASDGKLSTTANVLVTVTANAPPHLGAYAAPTLLTGAGAVITPTSAPTDELALANVSVTASAGFTGTLSADARTGVVSVSNAGPAGTHTITVTATDSCNLTAMQSFLLTVNRPNTPPVLTLTTGLTRQQGSPASVSTIATVSDGETAASDLVVTATNLPTGVSFTEFVNDNGTLTAQLAAECAAALGNQTITLKVSDGTATTSALLSLKITANTAPLLGGYAATSVNAGEFVNIAPNAAPSDNGSLRTVTLNAPASFSGTLSINQETGRVTVTNANPAGQHTLTVSATDNCGTTTTQTIVLTVIPPSNAPCTVMLPNLAARFRGENHPKDELNVAMASLGPGAQYSAGIVGQAFSLNGNGSYVALPARNLGSSYTVEFWLYPTRSGGWQHVLSHDYRSPNFGALYLNGSRLSYWANSNLVLESPTPLPLNQWTHVALTYDGQQARLYLNGMHDRTSGAMTLSFNTAVRLGDGNYRDSSNTLQGRMDEVSFYSRSLSAPEIQTLAQVNASGNCAGTPPPPATNTSPQITAAAALPQQQGSSSGAALHLATVTDAETVAEALLVTVTTIPAGLTVSGLTNQGGLITAFVGVSCTATPGPKLIVLTVTDAQGAQATASLTIHVQTNTPPMLGDYPATSLTANANLTILPNAPPADNGTVTNLTLNAPGLVGALSLDPVTGAVSVSNPGVPGTYSVLITATDNCGATSTRNFTLTVTATMVSNCQAGPANLAGWYRGEGNANDQTGSGPAQASSQVSFDSGRSGQAFRFSGNGSYVSLPARNLGTVFSVEFWVNPAREVSNYQHLLTNDWRTPNFGGLYQYGRRISYWADGAQVLESVSQLPLNQWTHLAISFDGSVARLYLNGRLEQARTFPHLRFNNPLRLGDGVYPDSSLYFQGLLDEVSFYSAALSESEIQALFQAGGNGKCVR